jgi:hypothetical protein
VPQRKIELWRVRLPLQTLIFNIDEAVALFAQKPERTAAQGYGIPLRRLTKPTNRCIFESGVALEAVSD